MGQTRLNRANCQTRVGRSLTTAEIYSGFLFPPQPGLLCGFPPLIVT